MFYDFSWRCFLAYKVRWYGVNQTSSCVGHFSFHCGIMLFALSWNNGHKRSFYAPDTIRTLLEVLYVMFVGCPSVWVCVCESLRESHQIYNFCALGDKDELMRFWVNRQVSPIYIVKNLLLGSFGVIT